jgi:methyl-accepting chemotaxis protein
MTGQTSEDEVVDRQTTDSSHEFSTVIEEIATLAEDGHEKASSTEAKIEEIVMEASEARQSIAELNETVDQISEIVDLIDDVANQTNVLALNASIESARTGENGDGFAVVADEIKQLAQETHDQTEEIEEFVSSVESDIDQTVENLETVNESISEAIGLSHGATSNFEKIQRRTDSFENDEPTSPDASLDEINSQDAVE